MVDFSNIASVVLYTKDMERALTFYTKVLGLQLVASEPSFVTFQTQKIRLHLHLADNLPKRQITERVKLPQVSFKVDDIDAAFQYLQTKKTPITREIIEYSPTTFVFNFLDPDGNALACESDTRKMASNISSR